MAISNFKLKAGVAAVAMAMSSGAFAALNLDAATTANHYASEMNITPTVDLLDGVVTDLNASAAFGASFATDAVAYVRFDLSSGTFVANPTYAVNGSTGAASVSVAQGGAGQPFVIFAVAPASGENLVGANVGTLTVDATGIRVANKDAVTIQYALYETLTNAANENLPLKDTGSRAYIDFIAALVSASGHVSVTDPVADVNAANGPFENFTPIGVKRVGYVDVNMSGAAIASGNAAVVGDILTNTNAVTLTGDFGGAGGVPGNVFLDNNADCSSSDLASTSNSTTGASFNNVTAALLDGQAAVCYNPTTNHAIAATTFVASVVDRVAQAGFTVADETNVTLGSITRNGAQTTALNITAPGNPDVSYIRISNMGSGVGRVYGTMYDQDGVMVGAANSVLNAGIVANGTAVMSSDDIAAALGVAGWTGRAKLVITGEIPDGKMRVQLLIRSNNILTNMSGDTSDFEK